MGLKQDIDVVPVGSKFTGNPAVGWVVIVGHGGLQWLNKIQ
jgi:hypothetical protein